MIDAQTGFAWFVSSFNFLILAWIFNKAVVRPLIALVEVRAARITARLKEIDVVFAEARKMEASYTEQFSRLETEEEELRVINARELERVTQRIQNQTRTECEHLVAKAGREAEKMRVDALAQLQHQMVVKAVFQVEGLLRTNLDAGSHDDINRQILDKVGALRVS